MNEMLVVRKIDKKIYKRFKQKALELNDTMGDAITEAMTYWLNTKKSEEYNPKTLLKLNGIIKTEKRVKWSEQINKILYDW